MMEREQCGIHSQAQKSEQGHSNLVEDGKMLNKNAPSIPIINY